MPTSQRRTAPGVIDQLLADPQRFEFCQAVSLLERWLRRYGVSAQTLFATYLRFENHLTLAFPASQIEALSAVSRAPDTQAGDVTRQTASNAAELLAALRDGRLEHLRLRPAFMGLLGNGGALPIHYTARIAAHERSQQDGGPRAFLDLFSNRSLGLFYQAWAKHRPECLRDQHGEDTFLALLRALGGHVAAPRAAPIPPEAEPAVAPETLDFYAAQLRSRRVPASAIAGVLSDYFGLPVVLEQLVGGWQALPLEDQAQLGCCNVTLGTGVLPGNRIYRRDQRAWLKLGPLHGAQFEDFLPGMPGCVALTALLARFCTVGMLFEIHLVRCGSDLHGCRLNPGGGTRLGIDAFLLAAPPAGERADMRYLLSV